jgi:hypothetical protein
MPSGGAENWRSIWIWRRGTWVLLWAGLLRQHARGGSLGRRDAVVVGEGSHEALSGTEMDAALSEGCVVIFFLLVRWFFWWDGKWRGVGRRTTDHGWGLTTEHSGTF